MKTTIKENATPGPFHWHYDGVDQSALCECGVYTPEGVTVAVFKATQRIEVEANAERFTKAMNEHAALVAVAEAAEELKAVSQCFLNYPTGLTIKNWAYDDQTRWNNANRNFDKAIAALAAVRDGKVVGQSAGKLDNYTREVVAAEFGYKCCESGLNLRATIEKLRAVRAGKAVVS